MDEELKLSTKILFAATASLAIFVLTFEHVTTGDTLEV